MALELNGTTGVSLVQDGVVGPRSVQVFTSDGTYTLPDGIGSIIVEVQAAGGGAAATNVGSASGPSIGSSGGAGGYARKLITNPNSSVSVTVGSGGAGGASSGASGGNGGSSSFGSYCSATGGSGGSENSAGIGENGAHGGAGGSGTGGDINLDGEYGHTSFSMGSIYSGTSRGVAVGGNGGSSVLGAGARSGYIDGGATDYHGNAPQGYGSGAGGTGSADGAFKNAQDGADGIVIVWEFK